MTLYRYRYDIMQRCWKTHAEHRPTFGDIVADIEDYLSELMNYFNPFTCSGRETPPPDPYTAWRLMSISEEVEHDENVEKSIEENTQMKNQKLFVNKSDIVASKKKPQPNASGGGHGGSKSTIARMVLSMTKGASLGMVRRSSSNALFVDAHNATNVIDNRSKREVSV